jgi:hypothetical protein
MSVDILRKGNTYKFQSSLTLNGEVYPNLGTADVVKCALVEVATGTNVLQVDSTDPNISLDDPLTGDVSWILTPAQTGLLNTGPHSLAVQVEIAGDIYEWVEDKIVNVKPEYIIT